MDTCTEPKPTVKKCRFCEIIKKKLEPIIWENDEFYAVLDAKPNTKGVSLVITKEHYPSYVFSLDSGLYQRFMLAAKEVVGLLEKKLEVVKVAMVVEGLGVDHTHIKLYPLHGLDEKFEATWAEERVYFKKYAGGITTQLGPEADAEELRKLAEKIVDAPSKVEPEQLKELGIEIRYNMIDEKS